MRLFVAIDVSPSTAPGEAQELRPAAEHLTLDFLGEVPPGEVPTLRSALDGVARAATSFDLVLEGVGAFPNRRNPRVVWVGVTRGRPEVIELAGRIASALHPGVPGAPRDAFVPHLTLFRVRSPAERRRAAALLDGTVAAPPARTVHVRELFLKESVLGPGGARHRTVASWPLTGGDAPTG